MRKKFAALLVMVLVLIFSLGATGTAEKEASEVSGKTVLTLYYWGNQLRNDLTRKVVDLYMEENPDIEIKLEFTDWSGYWDKLAASAAGGNMPDIIQQSYTYIVPYIENGLMADLTPYIESGVIDTTNIPQSIIDSGSLNGKCYALSLGSNVLAMIYDKAITDAAGVVVPDTPTFSDLYEIGEAVYNATGVRTLFDGSGTRMLRTIARSYGKAYEDELTAGNPEYALQHFQTVERFNNSPSALPADILSERNPEIVETKPILNSLTWNDYSWSNQYIAIVEASGRPLEMTMYPRPDDYTVEPMYFMPSMFFSISESSQHKDEAAAFINWFTNSAEANEILAAERGIPVSTEVAEAIKPAVSDLTTYIFDYVAEVGKVATPIDPPDSAGAGQVEAIENAIVEDIRYGVITPETAAKDFTERAQRIMLENI